MQPKRIPPKPSSAEVSNWQKIWSGNTAFKPAEDTLEKLFLQYSRNIDIVEIYAKVIILNTLYSTYIENKYLLKVAEHIQSIKNIDMRIKNNDPTVVDDIADTDKIIGRRCCSFATKYCSFHNPNSYPIYDKFVEETLRYFNAQYCFTQKINMQYSLARKNFYDEFFAKNSKNTYADWKAIIDDFVGFPNFNINGKNYKDIDRYLWQLGKDLFL